ncbi:MAG: type II CRISPR RNA-guided endonuclease Cas9, partial [Prevotella sp.]
VGQTGSKKTKFVEAQSGTNLYFAIYEDKEGKRNFETIALNVAAERLKTGQTPVPETNDAGQPLKFYLSPNDLVYVPTDEDRAAARPSIDKRRIYKMVSATDVNCFFLPFEVASTIYNKVEFESMNKMGRAIDMMEYSDNYDSSAINKLMIKDVCWKLEVDRLGNITKIVR